MIIVLWVAFGLVTLALYFASAMSFELRAANNRVAGLQAELAVQGAALYASNLLATVEEPGWLEELLPAQGEDMPVGEARFWLLGRADHQLVRDLPNFGLVDEASKLNLNTATRGQLETLPFLTNEPALAGAILDWRDANGEVADLGAEDETYLRLDPPYRCKNGPFESVEELRLVYGLTLEVLYGEDSNLNGILDPNENDGDFSPPDDNRDGVLDAGLLEFVTVYSREPMSGRTNVNDAAAISALLEEQFGQSRANELRATAGLAAGEPGQASFGSVLEFYVRSGMSSDEFDQVYGLLCSTNAAFVEGLINVNTASETVLACVPGIEVDGAASLVGTRLAFAGQPQLSLAWVVEALGEERALRAAPFLTARSFQYTADIAALGQHDRGFRRARYVFDVSDGTPKVVFRQDLTHLGWALGAELRRELELGRDPWRLAARNGATLATR